MRERHVDYYMCTTCEDTKYVGICPAYALNSTIQYVNTNNMIRDDTKHLDEHHNSKIVCTVNVATTIRHPTARYSHHKARIRKCLKIS